MEQETYTGSFRRPRASLELDVVRELTAADLVVRETLGAASPNQRLKSLRATHHQLAQCLTIKKMSDSEASAITGYSPSRISILKGDPSFQELLSFYSTQRDEVYVDVVQRMAGVATQALEIVQERLDDAPESFKAKDLTELIKATADRGGFSPVQKKETKTITLTGDDLRRMKEEVNAKQYGQIRKIHQGEEAVRVKLRETEQIVQDNQEPPLGANDNGPACDLYSPQEAPGREGEGNDLREACRQSPEEST